MQEPMDRQLVPVPCTHLDWILLTAPPAWMRYGDSLWDFLFLPWLLQSILALRSWHIEKSPNYYYSDPSLGCASRTNTRDTMSGQALRTLKGHTSTIYSVSLSFDGKLLASSSVSRGSREWGESCCSQPQPA